LFQSNGRRHRKLLTVHNHLHKGRPIVGEGPLQRGTDVFRFLDADSKNIRRFSQPREPFRESPTTP
jgi:hypothetical protein